MPAMLKEKQANRMRAYGLMSGMIAVEGRENRGMKRGEMNKHSCQIWKILAGIILAGVVLLLLLAFLNYMPN